jgi:hypothetical protein
MLAVAGRSFFLGFLDNSGHCRYIPPMVFGVFGWKFGPKNVRNFHLFALMRAFVSLSRVFALF